jgi:6-phosphogluconolactonase
VTDPELQVVESEAEAARVVAELLAGAARAGSEIALTGGATPRRAYELTVGVEPDWSRAGVWWGDERCVPPDDERSNFRLARESLLDRLEREPRAVHRIQGELEPDRAAAAYEQELQGIRLDLILLGIGPDGHVASLFPNAPSLEVRERPVVSAPAQLEPFIDRVTLTLPALCAGREVVFLVTGEEKAEAVERAFAAPASPETPASLVRSAEGRTLVVLDSAAASRLRS